MGITTQVRQQQQLHTKINGQQQQQQQPQSPQSGIAGAVTQQQQQQHLSTCSTMPAMPKEKATAVSLSESNFTELKLKELPGGVGDAVVVATDSDVDGDVNDDVASVAVAVAVAGGDANGDAGPHTDADVVDSGPAQQSTANATAATTLALALATLQPRSTCDCGAAAAANSVATSSGSSSSGGMSNGHASRSALGRLVQQNGATAANSSSTAIATNNNYNNNNNSNSNSNHHHHHNNHISSYHNNNNNNSRSAAAPSSSSSSSSNNNTTSRVVAPTPAAVTPPRRSPRDYMFGLIIGEGSFSIVYRAVEIATRREFAIKVCEKSHILREHKQEYIRREREAMHMMANVPGFVSLSCTFQDNRSLYFVMTHAKNGDMLPFITRVGSFDADCTRHYAAELVLACEEMHSRNIVHRDLKPENILLDDKMHTLIADFGSAKILTAADFEEIGAATADHASGAASSSSSTSSNSSSSSSSSASASASASSSTVMRSYAHAAPSPATAATAASCVVSGVRRSRYSSSSRHHTDDDDEDDDDNDANDINDANDTNDTNDTGSDDVDSPSRQPRFHHHPRRRRGSFVGTAQYVSPEVLQNGVITPAADLWALGCIIYQMISGLPPFRGNNDYVIFRHILSGRLDFPDGFDKDAEDLVRQLLKLNPEERLGAEDMGGRYHSIRSHPFFVGIDFNSVRSSTPPPIYPYLPGVSNDEEFRLAMSQEVEPGLDDRRRTRLLGMKLGTSLSYAAAAAGKKRETAGERNPYDLSKAEKKKRLEQQKSDIWHVFADNEVILMKGFVNKRKGLFARKRMLLLTTGPRLIYIDPVHMIKKGEIPWSPALRVDPKNFKIFFVNTPNRTYYLEDPEGRTPDWVNAIRKMAELTYGEQAATCVESGATVATSSSPPSSSSSSLLSSSSPLTAAAPTAKGATAVTTTTAAAAAAAAATTTTTTTTTTATAPAPSPPPPTAAEHQSHQSHSHLHSSQSATATSLPYASASASASSSCCYSNTHAHPRTHNRSRSHSQGQSPSQSNGKPASN